MKTLRICLALTVALISAKISAQASFTLAPSICQGGSATLSANAGTMTAIAYSWAALPSGPLFSSTSSQTSTVSFPVAGVFTVGLGILTGSGISYTTSVISVTPGVAITIVPSSPSVCAGFQGTLSAFASGISTFSWTGSGLSSPVMSPSLVTGPGSYTVTGNTSAGCISEAAATLAVSPPLVISTTQSSLNTCITSNFPKYSKPVHLTASGASTYAWFPFTGLSYSIGPATDARPAATTCYTVIGSTAACTGSAEVCVTVTPQFTAAVTPSAPIVCWGDHTKLAISAISTLAIGPSSAFTYSWTESINAPPISISDYISSTVTVYPQNSTTYTAEVMDAAGCISLPILVAVSVQTCTGVNAMVGIRDHTFAAYPNPMKDRLMIRTDLLGATSIDIVDAIGRILVHETRMCHAEAPVQTINVSAIPAGIYFVHIKNGTEERIIKMVRSN